MTMIKDAELLAVAMTIRDHITPIITMNGYVSDDDVRGLTREHTGRNIISKRSVRKIEQYMVEM